MKGKTYRYFDQKPLYEFGFGLSYSNFEYSKVAIPIEVKAGENIKVSVNVKNISKISGEEVVQLYVSLPESKLQTSIRSLQGFKRVYLKAGETKTVEFELKPTQFAARDNNNVQIIEPGTVEISIGGKQPDESSIAAKKVVKCGVKVLGHKFIIPN
jgi:beta-glucosidase